MSKKIKIKLSDDRCLYYEVIHIETCSNYMYIVKGNLTYNNNESNWNAEIFLLDKDVNTFEFNINYMNKFNGITEEISNEFLQNIVKNIINK